jgi:hypothetical protein
MVCCRVVSCATVWCVALPPSRVVTLRLPAALVEAVDLDRGWMPRNEWLVRAVCERLGLEGLEPPSRVRLAGSVAVTEREEGSEPVPSGRQAGQAAPSRSATAMDLLKSNVEPRFRSEKK